MFKETSPSAGFAAMPHDERATHGDALPVLLAIVSLFLSTAVLLTVTVSAARAAQLF